MGWRIIEIRSEDNLKLHLNNLLIKRNFKKILINIPDIDVLLIDNYKITLSVQLINAVVRNNGIIIVFNTRHEPESFIFPVKGNHNSLKIFENQMLWTNVYKGQVWKNVVKNKIANQLMNLKFLKLCQDEKPFHKFIQEVKDFDVTNREGHAAKIYWHTLFSKKFIRDYKAIKFPVINSMLNYGYSLLRSMVIKSIIKKGLDPRISIFHKSFTNFFALSSDLMEPFRPLVDNLVYKYKDNSFFSYEIKNELINLLNEKLIVNDKNEFLNNAIDKCINNLIIGKGWLWVNIWK